MRRTSLVLLGAGACFTPGAIAWVRLAPRAAQAETRSRTLEAEVDRLRRESAEAAAAAKKFETVARRLEALEGAAATLGSEVAEAATRADRAREQASEISRAFLSPDGAQARFDEAIHRLDEGLLDLRGDLQRASGVLADVERERREDLGRLEARLERDPVAMGARMIAPAVQLTGEETVGSGVVVSVRAGASGDAEYFVLTSQHVVRNILSESSGAAGIRLLVYDEGGHRGATAEVIAQDEDLDAALLRFRLAGPPPPTARPASSETLATIGPFTSVYTVGCPLGNDPIPTLGEVASVRSRVNGQDYWMINAPAYFGNSGGGVYLASTQELVGIFSKIYTHGRGRPTVVTHMGLVTPLPAISRFLSKAGYGELLGGSSTPSVASGKKAEAP